MVSGQLASVESRFKVAADTAAVSAQGHRTEFLGTTEMVILTIPAKDDLVPEHIVLHDGPYTADNGGVLRLLATGFDYFGT